MKKKNIDIGEKNAHQPDFYRKVYRIVASIPPGKISTYGAVAKACGCPRGSRAVGNALGCNRDTTKVPCHRVVRNDRSLGGYAGGAAKKSMLLKQEGLLIKGNKVLNFDEVLFELTKKT